MARDRVVKLRRVRAGDLQPDPRNWRRHPPGQRTALSRMLDRLGHVSRAVRGRGPILEQDVRHTASTPHWTRQRHDVGPTRRPSAEVAAPPPARVRTSQSRGRPSLFSRPLDFRELYTRLHDADKASKGLTTL